jgi:hypothetical protein
VTKNASPSKELNGRDKETGQFVKGYRGGPGRQVGSRNKLGEAFIADLHARWIKDGPQVLDAVIKNKPHEFMKVVASLLPRQFDETLNLNVSMLAEVSDFVEAYRFALHHIGSDKAKLING